jgi:multisubunit Na+/H+ antiporter MnhB subunit
MMTSNTGKGVLVGAMALALGGTLGWAAWSLPERGEGLTAAVNTHLTASGVRNPVTAVLLNFRGYDTLLEVGVLLLALLAVWSVSVAAPLKKQQTVNPSQRWLANTLIPLSIITSGYLLWIGAYQPGGAFQAGALLAGAAVLAIISDLSLPVTAGFMLRLLLSIGLLVFIVVGTALTGQGYFLQYPQSWAGTLILTIETAATVSIGVTLAALFIGHRPIPLSNSDSTAPKDGS